MSSLSSDWGMSRLEKQRGSMSCVCTSLAPSRRPSWAIHLSFCGLTVCPDLLQPVFVSQFVSHLNGCLLYALLTTEHGYESPAGVRALTCSHTLLLANPARLLDFHPQMASFLSCFWEKVVKNSLVWLEWVWGFGMWSPNSLTLKPRLGITLIAASCDSLNPQLSPHFSFFAFLGKYQVNTVKPIETCKHPADVSIDHEKGKLLSSTNPF